MTTRFVIPKEATLARAVLETRKAVSALGVAAALLGLGCQRDTNACATLDIRVQPTGSAACPAASVWVTVVHVDESTSETRRAIDCATTIETRSGRHHVVAFASGYQPATSGERQIECGVQRVDLPLVGAGGATSFPSAD